MIRIKEFAGRYGLSVRTLHYYHQIGILAPAYVDEKEQRWYGEVEGRILEQILRYKEMDFSLAEIGTFLRNGRSDNNDLLKQKEILLAKIRRIEESVSKLDEMLGGNVGDKDMNKENKGMEAMDNYDRLREEYRKEAKELYGHGEAYKQSEERTKDHIKKDWDDVKDSTEAIFRSFNEAMRDGRKPSEVENLVEEWRGFISSNFYDCTLEILGGLSNLYLADERFMKNLDSYGEGTAEFISEAIRQYVAAR